jgi:homospermidine synthase
MTVVDPKTTNKWLLDEKGISFVQEAVTESNYRELLTPLLTRGEGQGFMINLSVDTSSLALMKFCRERRVLYIDTVTEPWLGYYFNK